MDPRYDESKVMQGTLDSRVNKSKGWLFVQGLIIKKDDDLTVNVDPMMMDQRQGMVGPRVNESRR